MAERGAVKIFFLRENFTFVQQVRKIEYRSVYVGGDMAEGRCGIFYEALIVIEFDKRGSGGSRHGQISTIRLPER
jgi:hypothetical protein